MRFTIFANGEINLLNVELPKRTKIIAANGGAQQCLRFGIRPDILIGDFDSITPSTLALMESGGVEVVRHHENKNETDLELAINFAVAHGATEIKLLGLLGGRWDMSFANILLLSSPQYSKIDFHVLGDNIEMYILRNGKSITLVGEPGDPVSVLPLGGSARGITYSGLAWILRNANLDTGSPLGVSNFMLGNEAAISLDSGILLIIHSLQKAESDITQNKQ